ncbi:MAG: AAA family ATPase, partial [Phycisphaeraceae bacterium]|nr:AAA family ATPase [Phycisphaeraceae bacterium]
MAKQRIVSGQVQDEGENRLNLALRPTRLDDYVGQPRLVKKLRIALTAAASRGEPMEHVLLHGPPGLGKTTLAHIIANELKSHLVSTSGPALTRPADLVGTLTK